jgi:hypothetical protein
MRIGLDRRVLSLTVVLGLCVLTELSAAMGASAVSRSTHVFSTTFTGSGANALSEPSGVAVSSATGDVYVVDKGHNRVEEFDSAGTTVLAEFDGSGAPTGAFSAPEAIAVDNSTSLLDPSAGDVYVTDTGHGVIDKFGSTGTYLGQITTGAGGAAFGALNGVAVDSKGMLWVYQAIQEIDEYDNAVTNTFLSSRNSPFGESPGFAVDSKDDLYVNRGAEVYAKLDVSGATLLEEVDAETSRGAAVDLSSDEVYIDNVTTVGAFSASGSPVERFGSEHLTSGSGVAVNSSSGNPSSGTVYVADSAGNDVAVFASRHFPDVNMEPVSNLTSRSVTLKGVINPENEGSASCQFEYGPTESYGSTAPCSPAPGSGNSPVAVAANVTGLVPDTTYHYRLSATNINGTNTGSDEQFTTRGAAIHGESAEHVLLTSAKLRAMIDPNGTDATYHFEYDTSPYETSAPHGKRIPVPDADIGSGSGDVAVSLQPEDLKPGTTYHYRVVVVSEVSPGEHETFDGPDKAFTTFASQGYCSSNEELRAEQPYALELPDCRAYEMVSPLDKNDNNIVEGQARAAASGQAVMYYSKGAFAEPRSALVADAYIGGRERYGWSTRNITPPFNDSTGSVETPFEELYFSSDLSKGLLRSIYTPLTSDSPAGYTNLYIADFGAGTYQAVTGPPPGVGPYEQSEISPEQPQSAGVSDDLSHVVFQESGREGLTPEASPNHTHVYEWTAGHLSLVDIPPEGKTFGAEDTVGAPGVFHSPTDGDVWHAVSADGSRVFFTGGEDTSPVGGVEDQGQVYVREVDQARTVEVSASHKTNGNGPGGTDENGPQPARYWDASADGLRVFFTSRSELTNDANTGPADNAANLYEYNLDTGVLTDVTVDTNTGDVNGAEVLGLATASEDGSYTYFVANGDLAEGATSGKPNMYLRHDGKVTFIATLAAATEVVGEDGDEIGGDSHDWHGGQPQYRQSSSQNVGPGSHTVRVTPEGTRLAFESELSLTGYDNEPTEPGQCRNNRCREVYLYEVARDTLVCASCDPSGTRPTGPSELGGTDVTENIKPGPSFYLPRNLSEDGSRLFFESFDSLVTHDSNGQQDVYEYEDGRVYPISDVAGNHGSYFLDAGANGDDVFIATSDQLLPSDTDFRRDVYDVKVDGGFPVSVAAPACDNGDSCKAPVSSQPGVFGAPASATFAGAGNVSQGATIRPATKAKTKSKVKPCRRGAAKRHARCVKRKAKKSGGHSKKGRR